MIFIDENTDNEIPLLLFVDIIIHRDEMLLPYYNKDRISSQ